MRTLSWLRKATRCGFAAASKQYIRNFCILAHIDHGKSTLADRFIEMSMAGFAVEGAQVLDKLKVEQERGITVKSQTCSLQYQHKNASYTLNLIDTPGHSDFAYEVTKTLYSAEGALLLVDASKGVQAQTLANYLKAKALGLKIIAVVNKIDLPAADPAAVEEEICNTFGFAPEEYASLSDACASPPKAD